MNARTDLQTKTQPVTKVPAASFAIFTIPKPFEDPHIACIQRNAIASWCALGSDIEVILIGDDAGVAETAIDFGVTHVNDVDRNEHGTPLVSSAFEIAKSVSDAPVLVYCNADVILLHDFKASLIQLLRADISEEFLAIGRRTDLDVDHSIDFNDRIAVKDLLEKTEQQGTLASIVCKEYFAFTRNLFHEVPPFAVGRGNWDNWMVANTKQSGVPVVDLSDQTVAVHQNHGYQHIDAASADRRKHCYVSGNEARENERLAGGKHIISGSTTCHRLTDSGVVKNLLPALNLKFWSDLPRFARLVRGLFFS
ncbi:hypothetical protein OAG71_00835 [bacterium]|nr:hypothetical protein [bacterium]